MRKLSDRQRACLEFIDTFIRVKGYPPSIRDIGRELKITSNNGVTDHLKALERKGYLYRETGLSRAIQVLKPREEWQ